MLLVISTRCSTDLSNDQVFVCLFFRYLGNMYSICDQIQTKSGLLRFSGASQLYGFIDVIAGMSYILIYVITGY